MKRPLFSYRSAFTLFSCAPARTAVALGPVLSIILHRAFEGNL